MNAFTSFQTAVDDTRMLEQRKRHRRDMDRLRRGAEALILSHRGVSYVGEHDEVAEIGIELGLERHDFCTLEVRIKDRRVVVVCVPSRHWQSKATMETFHELKALSVLHGYTVLLVPQSFIQRQPRFDNAMLVSPTAGVTVSPSDRMSILGHLIEHGDASVYELASLVKHGDPISCVLHLVTTGALHLDLNTRITPHTLIGLSQDH